MRTKSVPAAVSIALMLLMRPIAAKTDPYADGAKHVEVCQSATIAAAANSHGQHRTDADTALALKGLKECQAALDAFPKNAWVAADYAEYGLAIAGTAASIHDQAERNLKIAFKMAEKTNDIWTEEKACRYFQVYGENRPDDLLCTPQRAAYLKTIVDQQWKAYIAELRRSTQAVENQTQAMQQTEMEANGWRQDANR